MSEPNNRRPGGLILHRADLQTILDEPDTFGIAFALQAPGQAENVDLQVLKVSVVDDRFVGEVRPIPTGRKHGVAGPLQYPVGHCDDFEFHHLEKLKNDGYFFGFFNKFDDIFKGRGAKAWDQIFIGGGKRTYVEGTFDQDEWFTFTIAVRKGLKERRFPQRHAAHEFLRGHIPNKPLVPLPHLKNFGSMKMEEVARFHPNGNGLKGKEVEALVRFGPSDEVAGLVFADGSKYLFDEKTRVESVQLDVDYELKAVHLPPDPMLENLGAEVYDLGAIFPYADQTVGCPPYWPDNLEKGEIDKKNLRQAILDALKNNRI